MLTQETLKEFLDYDPATGVFVWKKTPKHSRLPAGRVGGYDNGQGYIYIYILGSQYGAHRLAFLWMTGYIPKSVDHINGDTTDNRWLNLRRSSYALQGANRKLNKNNRSGFRGVCYRNSKWQATIQVSGHRENLGHFNSPEKAYDAYCKRAKEAWGDHARL